MATLREQKQAARESLHRENSVEAYYCHGSNDPVEVTVRVHEKVKNLGEQALGFASRPEMVTTIVFLRSELAGVSGAPARGAYISVTEDEAYQLGSADPVHGITQEVEAARVSANTLLSLELPVR